MLMETGVEELKVLQTVTLLLTTSTVIQGPNLAKVRWCLWCVWLLLCHSVLCVSWELDAEIISKPRIGACWKGSFKWDGYMQILKCVYTLLFNFWIFFYLSTNRWVHDKKKKTKLSNKDIFHKYFMWSPSVNFDFISYLLHRQCLYTCTVSNTHVLYIKVYSH